MEPAPGWVRVRMWAHSYGWVCAVVLISTVLASARPFARPLKLPLYKTTALVPENQHTKLAETLYQEVNKDSCFRRPEGN